MIPPIFFGDQVVEKLKGANPGKSKDLTDLLKGGKEAIKGNWYDLAGMVVHETSLSQLIDSIKDKAVKSIQELEQSLSEIFAQYEDLKWSWSLQLLEDYHGVKASEIDKAFVIKLLEEWKTSSVKLNNMILKDAQKEFDASSKIGFGVDGDNDVRDKDFESVRGAYDSNKFVKQVIGESADIEKEAQSLIEMIEKLD
jgi:hypothetical protein